MVVGNEGQGRACLSLAHWPERTEAPAEAWGPCWSRQQFPHLRTAPALKGGASHLPSHPAARLLWLIEAYPGTATILLRTTLILCWPFRGEGGSQ